MDQRRKVDLTTYEKRNQFRWFETFPDPSYGFDVRMDVTHVVHLARKKGISFFETFLFFIMQGVHAVREMRMRIVDGEVYEYSTIHPTFTVMGENGIYVNAGCRMEEDFDAFVKEVRRTIEEAKSLPDDAELDRYPICKEPNVVYLTSIPTLSILGMRHPTPAGNHESLSVPRILFDRYRQEGERFFVTLNITVSHSLVDGFPLARCFQEIQKELNQIPTVFDEMLS